MFKSALALVFAITISAISVTADDSCPSSLVIDDFSSGRYRVVLRPDGHVVTAFRTGSMTGGSRYTIFLSKVIPTVARGAELNQRASLDVTPDGSSVMVVAAGIGVAHRFEAYYGFDLRRGQVVPGPLNLDLSCFSKFRIYFASNDLPVNFTMQVTAGNNPGNRAQHAVPVKANPDTPETQLIIEIPFSDFQPNAGPPPDFTDIDMIDIICQNGSAVGADDYAITLIEAVR
jgi:hypothetical protein